MRQAARAIIIQQSRILLIKRNKFGMEYYTLPGGGIESNETPEQSVTREVREETSLAIGNPKLLYREDAGPMYGIQHVYLCDYQGGEIKVDPNSIEAKLNADGQNTFEPLWVPLDQFANTPFRSTTLQKEILDGLANGWPAEPKMLESQAEISSK